MSATSAASVFKDDGYEFLLVLDDGSFSEDNTFLATSLFHGTPKEVLAKNFRIDVSAFDSIPKQQKYIFPGTPRPVNLSAQNSTGPAGDIPKNKSYSHHFSRQQPYTVPGSSVNIIDLLTSQNRPPSLLRCSPSNLEPSERCIGYYR
jgi:hypothetical protein